MTDIGIMQQKCTNSNFKEISSNGGFENECALCVVILRVMENYISYHKVGVADFINNKFCDLFDNMIKPTC